MPSVVTLIEVAPTVIPEPAPTVREVDPPKATDPPPVRPLPAVTVRAPEPVRLLFGNVPATSAVPRSTALVVEPEPMKMLEVSVLLTIASVMALLGSESVPAVKVKPLATVRLPPKLEFPVAATMRFPLLSNLESSDPTLLLTCNKSAV